MENEKNEAPAAPPEIPTNEALAELTAAKLMDLADAHGLPQSPTPAINIGRLTALRDGKPMPDFAEVEALPPIPDDAGLDALSDKEVYHLARAHQLPLGEDPSREGDIAGLKIKRNGGVAVTEDGKVIEPAPIGSDTQLKAMNLDDLVLLARAHGHPNTTDEGRVSLESWLMARRDGSALPQADQLPPIDDDETLEAMYDPDLNNLAQAHGIEQVTRAQTIDALKAKRDSLVVITPVPSDQEIAGLDEVQLRDLAARHGIETTNRVYADVLADLRAKRDLDAEAAQQ